MKKRILFILVTAMMMLSLSGCGKFKCDLCRQEKTGKSYTVEVLGQKVVICKDCYNGIKDLQEGIQGLFN